MRNSVIVFGVLGLVFALGLLRVWFINNRKLTTTPDDFLNKTAVVKQTYANDKFEVIKTVDSLIAVRVIYKPAEKATRHFDGKVYEDTVDRRWAINLPLKNITYLESYVDTIFYRPDDDREFAGLLISKTTHPFARNGIEYFGNGFIAKRMGEKVRLVIKGYAVTGSERMDQCRAALHDIYFREMGRVDSSFNLNDVRYWSSKSFSKLAWD